MSNKLLKSVLIANRGEIAVRIIRACKLLGVRSVSVYSEVDANALHVRLADEAYLLGPASAPESYLNIERILEVARESKVESVHPGYGFLSESPEFAAAVQNAGLVFIGPCSDVIAMMADKVAARLSAKSCGVPVLPGSDGGISDAETAAQLSKDIGFPLVVKACFGGGGRGMRVVREPHALMAALEEAGRESGSAFGRDEVFLEKYISHARHVEVQILADSHGNVLHLGDRDCSVQRRYQKLIEEAPAPALPYRLRSDILSAAVELVKSVNYQGAGTVEFLVDPAKETFYFLEMNTRLQVEHGVSELITGIDIVAWQLRIASLEALSFSQEDIVFRGHAIQARIGAENPWAGFCPDPGVITRLRLPQGPGIRLDFGVEEGDTIPGHYDAMFGKVQTYADTREMARCLLINSLEEMEAGGVATTVPYLSQVLREPEFVDVKHDTGSVERSWQPDPNRWRENTVPAPEVADALPTVLATVTERRVSIATLAGPLDIAIYGRGRLNRKVSTASGTSRNEGGRRIDEPVAPMESTIVEILVAKGDDIKQGDELVVLEAMKMELKVNAPRDGVVEDILVQTGDPAARGTLLIKLSN